MAQFHKKTAVDASLKSVWEFHSTGHGLLQLTPSILSPRIDRIKPPNGPAHADISQTLTEGTKIVLSVQPAVVGPRITWEAEITERNYTEDQAHFIDIATNGLLPVWKHRHQFIAQDDTTVAIDHITYEPPPAVPTAFVRAGLSIGFVYRHHRLRSVFDAPSSVPDHK